LKKTQPEHPKKNYVMDYEAQALAKGYSRSHRLVFFGEETPTTDILISEEIP